MNPYILLLVDIGPKIMVNVLFLEACLTLVFMLSIQYKIFRLTNWLICFHSKSKGISPLEAILIKTVSRVAKIRVISKAPEFPQKGQLKDLDSLGMFSNLFWLLSSVEQNLSKSIRSCSTSPILEKMKL